MNAGTDYGKARAQAQANANRTNTPRYLFRYNDVWWVDDRPGEPPNSGSSWAGVHRERIDPQPAKVQP